MHKQQQILRNKKENNNIITTKQKIFKNDLIKNRINFKSKILINLKLKKRIQQHYQNEDNKQQILNMF